MEPFIIILESPLKPEYGDVFTSIINSISNGQYWHEIETVWVFKCDEDAIDIRELLMPVLGEDPKVFVVGLTTEASWLGLTAESHEWLIKNLN